MQMSLKVINRDKQTEPNSYICPDLFEDLRTLVGCAYISDMRFSPWREMAVRMARQLDLKRYRSGELEDLAQYLFGGKARFSDYDEAQRFFAHAHKPLQCVVTRFTRL